MAIQPKGTDTIHVDQINGKTTTEEITIGKLQTSYGTGVTGDYQLVTTPDARDITVVVSGSGKYIRQSGTLADSTRVRANGFFEIPGGESDGSDGTLSGYPHFTSASSSVTSSASWSDFGPALAIPASFNYAIFVDLAWREISSQKGGLYTYQFIVTRDAGTTFTVAQAAGSLAANTAATAVNSVPTASAPATTPNVGWQASGSTFNLRIKLAAGSTQHFANALVRMIPIGIV